jgi:hypothetical protein
MRPLGKPQERKKVNQNLESPRGTYLDPRKARKSAPMGPSDGPIGSLNRAVKGFYFGSSEGP